MPFLGRFLKKLHLEDKVLWWRGPVDGGGETGRVWIGSNLDLGCSSLRQSPSQASAGF